jgi:integral membrane protein
MYGILLSLHSLFRWIVFLSLLIAIIRSVRGLAAKRGFSSLDNFIRHATATVAHIQLVLGYLLYFNSPFIRYFREHYREAAVQFDYVFFGILHILLMTIAILLITAGSSLAKRKRLRLRNSGQYCSVLPLRSCSFSLLYPGLFRPWLKDLISDRFLMLRLSTKVGRLRLVGILEGISLLVLLGIAVPFKYWYHDPSLVKGIGPVHGLFFLLYVFNAFSVRVEQGWRFKTTTWKVLLACMIPFGTFYIDRKILMQIS